MKKRDIKIWTSALRSGEYKQCKSSLHLCEEGESSFCCLGVAIDVLIDGDWSHDYKNKYHFEGGVGYPTAKTMRRLGLSVRTVSCLAEMNDGGSSFAEIADWIEANENSLDEHG